jgi:hypothetical protein
MLTFDWTKHDSGDLEIELPNDGPTARITQGEHAGPGTWTAAVFADPTEPHARPGCERHDFATGDAAQEWAEALMVELVDEEQQKLGMTEWQMRELVQEALTEKVFADVQSFEEAGLLTMNEGLVVRLNGNEFQLTVVRSR